LVFTVGVFAACSGSQAETIYDAGGGDSGGVVTNHSGSGVHFVGVPDGSTGTADVGTTFIDTGTGGFGDTGTGFDTGTTTGPDGSIVPPAGDGGGVCPSTCNIDSDCQAACPASPGAINCCDTVTSACFTSAATVCPDMTSGSGTGTGGGGDGGGY
jgi:hypothetical protein